MKPRHLGLAIFSAVLWFAATLLSIFASTDEEQGHQRGFKAGIAGIHVCKVVDHSPSSDFTSGALRGWIDAIKLKHQ
jgi:ribosome modulation factor